MSWLVVTISAYFLLAIVSLFDRYFLVGSIPHPKVYTFYVSMLWCLAGLLLIPFVAIPAELNLVIFLGLAAGFIRTFAILFLCKSIMESEVSRTIPTIGGFLPIFSFLFFFLITPNQEILDPIRLAAFICLVLGSVLISNETGKGSIRDIAGEFEIELLDDYMARALAHRHAPGNIED